MKKVSILLIISFLWIFFKVSFVNANASLEYMQRQIIENFDSYYDENFSFLNFDILYNNKKIKDDKFYFVFLDCLYKENLEEMAKVINEKLENNRSSGNFYRILSDICNSNFPERKDDCNDAVVASIKESTHQSLWSGALHWIDNNDATLGFVKIKEYDKQRKCYWTSFILDYDTYGYNGLCQDSSCFIDKNTLSLSAIVNFDGVIPELYLPDNVKIGIYIPSLKQTFLLKEPIKISTSENSKKFYKINLLTSGNADLIELTGADLTNREKDIYKRIYLEELDKYSKLTNEDSISAISTIPNSIINFRFGSFFEIFLFTIAVEIFISTILLLLFRLPIKTVIYFLLANLISYPLFTWASIYFTIIVYSNIFIVESFIVLFEAIIIFIFTKRSLNFGKLLLITIISNFTSYVIGNMIDNISILVPIITIIVLVFIVKKVKN